MISVGFLSAALVVGLAPFQFLRLDPICDVVCQHFLIIFSCASFYVFYPIFCDVMFLRCATKSLSHIRHQPRRRPSSSFGLVINTSMCNNPSQDVYSAPPASPDDASHPAGLSLLHVPTNGTTNRSQHQVSAEATTRNASQ